MISLRKYITEALDGSKMTYSGKNQEFVDVILQNTEGNILLLRRANYMHNFKTCWGVVGGSVEETDKTHKDAAIRETREETGYELSLVEQNNMKYLFDYTYKDGNISHVYNVKLESDINVKISREHSKYEWVDFSEEKIDDRKWMPELFNILQKWEQTPVNERLIINKNYKDYEFNIDDLIQKYVNFNEGTSVYKYQIDLNFDLRCNLHSLESAEIIPVKTFLRYEYKWKDECLKHMYLDDNNKGYIFISGERSRKFKFSKTADSIEELIAHIDKNDKQIIYSENGIDGTLFEVFYIIGKKYTFVTLGSTTLRYSYIMPINK